MKSKSVLRVSASWWFLSVALAAAALAQTTTTAPASQPSSQPAPDTRSWLVDFPDKSLTVIVSYPKGWTNSRDAANKPQVVPPSDDTALLPPKWSFDIKSDPQKRPIDQLLAAYVKAAQAKNQPITESKLLDLPDGRKAGSLTYTLSLSNQQITTRNIFIPLDNGLVIMTTEQSLSPTWKDLADPFQKMSLSLKTQPLAK